MASPSPSSTIHLLIVSPDETIFEDEVKRIIAPGVFQEIAILPDHTPLYAELKEGEIQVTKTDNSQQTFSIESGIIRVKSNRASIITGF